MNSLSRPVLLAALGAFGVTLIVLTVGGPAVGRVAWGAFKWGSVAYAFDPTADMAYQIGVHHLDATNPRAYDIEKAGTFLDRTVIQDPAHPLVHFQLARVAFLENRLDAALRYINTHIDTHGAEPDASYYLRGLIHGYDENYAAAAKDFAVFLETNHDNWAGLNDYAWILIRMEDFKTAEAVTKKAATIFPKNPWVLNSHGVVLFELGRVNEAHDVFVRAHQASLALAPADWSRAYPGNDPRIAGDGLAALRESLSENINRSTLEGQ